MQTRRFFLLKSGLLHFVTVFVLSQVHGQNVIAYSPSAVVPRLCVYMNAG